MAKLSYCFGWAFIIILGALHFIKPETDPSWNFISEYQIGDYGWLMSLTFFSLALSCIFLSIALWRQARSVIGKIGLLGLLASASGMLIAGIFKTDPLNTTPDLVTRSGELHQLGATLDQIPFAIILISISLIRKNIFWHERKMLLIGLIILVWIGLFTFIVSLAIQFPADRVFGPNVIVGWQNRVMIVTQAVWLIAIAWQAKKYQTGLSPSTHKQMA